MNNNFDDRSWCVFGLNLSFDGNRDKNIFSRTLFALFIIKVLKAFLIIHDDPIPDLFIIAASQRPRV